MTTTIPAPFRSPPFPVREDWIDYNGHLNMGYYLVAADLGSDPGYDMLGIGRAYPQTHNHTFMTVETHVCYLREVLRGAHIVVELRVLGLDSKRAHVFSTVRNADAGYLAATAESLLLNIDLDTRRAAPWPEDIRQTLTRAKAAHEALAWPEQVGRRITLPGR